MELLKNLGINGKLLIAQIINFLVLLFVLYKFAYGPVLNMLDKRAKKIEKGLKDAEEAKRKLDEIENSEKEILNKAKKEAQAIIKKSEEAALRSAKEIEISAKDQSERIITEAKKQIDHEKDKVIKEAKSEIAGLVVSATEKIIGERLNSDKDKELIEKVIK